MIYRFILSIIFLSTLFSQNQVVLEEVMYMDASYVGEITTTSKKFAADGLYRQESSIDVDRFLIRMAMGGNKKFGTILDGREKTRIVYDANDDKYAFESFDLIRNNKGKPQLKGMDQNMNFGGGSNNRKNRDEDSDKVSEDEEVKKESIVERSITDEIKLIAGLEGRKVITVIKSSEGMVKFEEWFTMDTLLLTYVLNMEKNLIKSYGGEKQNIPRSFSELMLDRSGEDYVSMEGSLLKYSMEMIDEDEKGFKMSWELKSLKEVPFSINDFNIYKSYKKVDELD